MSLMLLGSLFADAKISLLINLILFTLVVAVILIIIERKIVHKQERKKEEDLLNYKISDFNSKVSKGQTPSERLAIINSVAKSSFEEWFGVKSTSGYSYLADYFDKRQLTKYKHFSEKMFELFYSTNAYSFAEVDRMKKLFAELIRETYDLMKSRAKDKEATKNKVASKKYPVKNKKETPAVKNAEKKSLSWSDIKMRKEVEKKQKEVMLQKRKNLELMKEAEKKLREQKKLEEELKKSLEDEKLDVSKKEKSLEKKDGKKPEYKKLSPPEVKKTPQDFTKWHEEIEIEPVMGKKWLKERRKKKKEVKK